MARYHDGVEKALKLDAPFIPPTFQEGLPDFLFSKRLLVDDDTAPVSATCTDDLALWNPCFSGMMILYTEFFQNLLLGGFVMNFASQIRSILHLSHALRERGVTAPSHELLQFLETVFGEKVWAVQPLPSMGVFAKHFWIAEGMRQDSAAKLAINTAKVWVQQPA